MHCQNQRARINVKLLIILILVTTAVGVSLVAARQVRRSILSKVALEDGQAAFDRKDWPRACSNFQEYLGRNPDDVEILKKYAQARLAIRPIDAFNIGRAIAAYRRVVQLAPQENLAYEKLAQLYSSTGNYEDLGYIARTQRERDPNDLKAPLWMAEALIRLNKHKEAQEGLVEFVTRLDALPEKHVEYVRACIAGSQIAIAGNSGQGKSDALDWLNRALRYAPDSAEALARRAQFYRQTPGIPNLSPEDVPVLARKDLAAAAATAADDPHVRYLVAAEWLTWGELDRAAAELQIVDNLPQGVLEEHFPDMDDWRTARFLLASELMMRKNAAADGVPIADGALASLSQRRHRVGILPAAVLLYVKANKIAQARQCLDEYLDMQHGQNVMPQSPATLAYLQAVVARAENNSYGVIDVLRPIVLTDASRPELWQLLAEAFSETDQPRRAVAALIQYLRFRPQDREMTLRLAKEYLKLQDWTRAFETAQLAEPLDATDIVLRLLRIETGVYVAADQKQASPARLGELSDELAELRAKNPDRVDIRILQAIVATYLGQPDKAEEELKLAMTECKDPLRAEMQLVRFYYGNKRMAEAIDVAKAACDRHANVAEPWLSLASLYTARADHDLARSCLTQGIAGIVDRWDKRSLSLRLALLDLVYGDRNAGVALLKDLAAQDKREVYARTLLLATREIQRDEAVAQRLIVELRDAEGTSGLMWRLHQASLWLSSEQWRSRQQDITELLRYCIDSDPQWPAPVLLLADLYGKLEDFRRVEDTYRQALARDPSSTEIADRLIALFERQGRFSEAEQILQQSGTDARLASAWNVRMALREGDFSRALDELKLRVSNDDQDADSRILLARLVYWQTRDVNEAFVHLKQAEAIAPDSMRLTAVKVSILDADGQTTEAERMLNDTVTRHGNFAAYAMRAAYLARKGQRDRAEADYRKLTTFADESSAGYILWSNFYIGGKEFDKAVATLEEGVDTHPDDPQLQRALMKLLFARGQDPDQPRGLDILTALEKQMPQDPELIKLRAVQMLRQPTPESLQAAKEKLELAVRLEPTAVDAHLTLIGIAMARHDYAGARDYAIRACGSNPSNLALLCARGRTELALENTPMAAQLARLGLAQDPNSGEARDVLVESALAGDNRGLLDEAKTLLDSWLARDPANEDVLIARARVLVSLGTPQMAAPELEAYCQSGEGGRSISALVTLADLYRLSGDVVKSREKIDQAQRIDPNSQRVVHARLLWLVAQKQLADLEGISSAYLAAKEQNPAILLTAGTLLSASDSMTLKKEGLRLLEHAVTLSPTSAKARFSLASALYQTGDVDQAEQNYRQVLIQNPTHLQAVNNLAWILQERHHNYAAALDLVNTGLSLARDDPHLLDTRGTILVNMKDRLGDARSDFQKLAELSPDDTGQKARALLQLGRVCARLNDPIQARQHLQKALAIDQKVNAFTADERSEIAGIVQP